MKKLLILSLTLFCLTNIANAKAISNEKIDEQKVKVASKIITDLQKDMKNFTSTVYGNIEPVIDNSKYYTTNGYNVYVPVEYYGIPTNK